MLLGVHKPESERETNYKIIGLTNPEKIIEDLVTQCRTIFNKPIKIETDQQVIENKIIISVFVPEVDSSYKPVFFKRKALPEGAYRRFGTSDIKCNEDDLQVFYLNKVHSSFDYTAISDAFWEDIDQEAIEKYRRERSNINPNANELKWNDQELLQSLGCVRKTNGNFKPTICGILMFGKQTSIRRFFPSMKVDYIREPGKQWISDLDKR